MPGLGNLSIVTGKSELEFLNNAIKAPAPRIVFEATENDASNLLDYIATKTDSTILQTIDRLGHFCNTLKAATIANHPATLDGVGNFFTDSSGKINFKSSQLPVAFLQPVTAERVIHPQAEHPILVGDKETTNTLMTEYFNEEPVQKYRWWIWAIVLGVIGLLTVLFYISNTNLSSMAGNAMPVQ